MSVMKGANMRRDVMFAVSLVIVGVLAGSIYADSKSRGSDKAGAEGTSSTAGGYSSRNVYTSEQLSSLNLTITQKRRIQSAQAMYNSKIEDILTPEQKTKLSVICGKTDSEQSDKSK